MQLKLTDEFTGSGTVGTAPTVCLPFTDVASGAFSFTLWLVNNSATETVSVAFQAAPDGVAPCMLTTDTFSVPPLGSVSMTRGPEECRRYWAIVAHTQTAPSVSLNWGVTRRMY